jgi:hypothetical protein
MIERHQIATNLASSNLTLLNQYSGTLKVIELVDMDIRVIGSNAFAHFPNLRSLKLTSNNLKHLDFSALSLTSVESTSSNRSQLIELDLSMNQLTNIRMESFAYLTSLRVLNLSHNQLKSFDLKFLAIVSPRLQVLDLSFNLLRKVKLLNDQDQYYLSFFNNSNSEIEDQSLVITSLYCI